MKTPIPAGAMLLAIACAAQAAPPGQRVDVSDLNLRTRAGEEALELRVRMTAREICGDPEEVVQLYAKRDIARCVRETVAWTMRRIRRKLELAKR